MTMINSYLVYKSHPKFFLVFQKGIVLRNWTWI